MTKIDYNYVKPINGKIIVKVEKEPEQETTASGLVLVHKDMNGVKTSDEKSNVAVVVSVADDVTQVKVGDTVIMDQYLTAELQDCETYKLYLVAETDIFGVEVKHE